MQFSTVRRKATVAADVSTIFLCLPAVVAAGLMFSEGQTGLAIILSLLILAGTSFSIHRILSRRNANTVGGGSQ